MNMTNQYKILALDLDGTLLDAQSRITPENARAVRMAQQAGVQIVLCTGRNVREVRRFSEHQRVRHPRVHRPAGMSHGEICQNRTESPDKSRKSRATVQIVVSNRRVPAG